MKNILNKINLDYVDSYKNVLYIMLIVVFYYVFIAADRYVSTMSLSVRSTSGDMASQASGILSVLTTTSNTNEDLKYLQGYIHSLDMLLILEDKIGLRKLYQEQNIDLPFKIWDASSIESFLKYYQNRVKIYVDSKTGLLNVDVEGFSPESSLLIAQTIMQESEKFINEISHKGAREQMAFAESEVLKYKERLQLAQNDVIAFQNQHGTFDPLKQAEAKATLVTELESKLATQEAALATLNSYMNDNAPEVVLLKAEIAALKKQLSKENAKIMSNDGMSKLNELSARYQDLSIELGFAQKAYEAALTALENARVEAARKIKQLVIVQSPALPETAKYPERIYNILTALLVLSLAFGILKFTKMIIEEHKY